MRLIDIESPCKIEIKLDGEKCHATVTAPTVDAVPVVRCKDCKHRQELRECPMYHLNYARYEWQLDDDCDDYTKDDGFCDKGERKDNADE